MKISRFVFAPALCLVFLCGKTEAQLFQQDFSSSDTISNYVSVTPNTGQFNAISSSGGGTIFSISNNALQYTRSSNAGSFSRTTDFNPTPTAFRYKFDLTVSGNTATTTNAAVWQVGSGYGTANSAETNANTYARIALNLTATDGTFQLRDINTMTNSANFSGTQTITWIMNNSGTSLNYVAPDGSTETLANDTEDVWVGLTKVFNDFAVQTTTQTISDLKFVFSAGAATVTMDNFLIDIPTAPTAVQMIELSAQVKATSSNRTVRGKGVQRGAVINWRTGFEVGNLGFNLYRDERGQRIKLNTSIIAGSALFAGAHTPLTAGQSYGWSDSAGDQGTQYWLEEIDLGGTSVWHGPVTATQIVNNTLLNRSERALLLDDLNQGANAAEQSEFVLAGLGDEKMRLSAPEPRAWGLPNQSVVKLPVRRAGWYRVTRQELAATGFNANVNPDLLQLFADGVEVPLRVGSATPGQFVAGDFIEFYGTGVDVQSTDTRVYWLAAGATPGLRLPSAASRETAATVSSFVSTVERKDKLIYFSGLLNGAAENWFGPVINATGATQLLATPFVERRTGATATLEAVLQGVTAQRHTIEVSVSGTVVGTATFTDKERTVQRFEIAAALLLEGENAVVFKATGGSSDISLVEAVRLGYPRKYATDDNPFSFSVAAGQTAYVSGFRTPGVRVLQLGNGGALREINVRVQLQNGQYGFILQSGSDATYLAYPTARFDRVLGATLNQPSEWRNPTNAAQFLIVTHKDFASSAQRLAQARQQQGWQVAVVDVEDAYDEFAFGARSPQAVKDLLTFARTNWAQAPSHVLLIGDASTDPRNYLELGSVDFVPTQLEATAYFETALDNWLVDNDNDGVPELALGRLPVRTAAQADAVVTKLLSVSVNPANRSAVLVSDRVVEGFDFRAVSQQLAGLLPAGLTKHHINRNDGAPDAVRAAIMQAINGAGSSPLVVNWLGHGSTQVWTGDGLLRTQDVSALVNSLPALFTMTTCLNGYFIDPFQVSLGEAVLTHAPGGAFAVVASTALNQPSTQISFNQQLYQGLFVQGQTVGEAVKTARTVVADQDVRNSYVLFGDPTMRLTSQGSKKE